MGSSTASFIYLVIALVIRLAVAIMAEKLKQDRKPKPSRKRRKPKVKPKPKVVVKKGPTQVSCKCPECKQTYKVLETLVVSDTPVLCPKCLMPYLAG